jgi:hypothetical protein
MSSESTGEAPWNPLSVHEAVALMDGFPARWWMSGGLALELHVGQTWRHHDDTDVGICRDDVGHLSTILGGWEIVVAANGELTPWDGGPLQAGAQQNNLWCRRIGRPWELDIVVGEGDDRRWVYRRDPKLALPWERVVLRTTQGVPYLAPALQLMYKSVHVRPKDQLDADTVIPALDPASVALLDLHLPRDHPWVPLTASRRRVLDGAEVVELIALLTVAGVAVWVDGGWGVDALLGEQTRPHLDLDIAVATRQLARTTAVLADHSFVVVRDDGPHNLVLGDDVGRLVDVHAFDDTSTLIEADGIDRHGPHGLAYEAGGFTGHGRIEDRPVRCMSAQFQMRSHTGYVVDEDDWHDISNLHRLFKLPIPDDYAEWIARTSGPT